MEWAAKCFFLPHLHSSLRSVFLSLCHVTSFVCLFLVSLATLWHYCRLAGGLGDRLKNEEKMEKICSFRVKRSLQPHQPLNGDDNGRCSGHHLGTLRAASLTRYCCHEGHSHPRVFASPGRLLTSLSARVLSVSSFSRELELGRRQIANCHRSPA